MRSHAGQGSKSPPWISEVSLCARELVALNNAAIGAPLEQPLREVLTTNDFATALFCGGWCDDVPILAAPGRYVQ